MSAPSQRPSFGTRPALLCLSHLRWKFVFQRPQHLLTRAAKDFRVFFFEEPQFGATRAPILESTPAEGGVTVLTPVLPEELSATAAVDAQRHLLDGFIATLSSMPRVGWYYTPMALRFSDHVRFPTCVYDCMDELSGFLGAPAELGAFERRMFEKADIVFTGGHSIYEAKRDSHDNIHAFPSSIDTAHFRPARLKAVPEPADLDSIARPRIGYFGVIDERLDLRLLESVAELLPQWQFVMVGPVAKIDPASLPRRDNVHWLGGKAYGELPAYLAGLDVGWMPFALNAATRFISPTKTPEFLAAGLPVVSTPIADVVRTWGAPGLVHIAATAEETVAAIARALASGRSAERLASVDAKLATTSWDATWNRMAALVDAAGLHGRHHSAACARSRPCMTG
jgi:glycosyltransferase involved in cell wall biosynthesis